MFLQEAILNEGQMICLKIWTMEDTVFEAYCNKVYIYIILSFFSSSWLG